MKKTRVRKVVEQEFGAGTYDKVLSGTKVLIINGSSYTVEELKSKNIFVADNATVSVVDAYPPIDEPEYVVDLREDMEALEENMKEAVNDLEIYANAINEAKETLKKVVLLTVEQLVGTEKYSDLIAGNAVLAINGEQISVEDIPKAKYLPDTKALILKAVVGG